MRPIPAAPMISRRETTGAVAPETVLLAPCFAAAPARVRPARDNAALRACSASRSARRRCCNSGIAPVLAGMESKRIDDTKSLAKDDGGGQTLRSGRRGRAAALVEQPRNASAGNSSTPGGRVAELLLGALLELIDALEQGHDFASGAAVDFGQLLFERVALQLQSVALGQIFLHRFLLANLLITGSRRGCNVLRRLQAERRILGTLPRGLRVGRFQRVERLVVFGLAYSSAAITAKSVCSSRSAKSIAVRGSVSAAEMRRSNSPIYRGNGDRVTSPLPLPAWLA